MLSYCYYCEVKVSIFQTSFIPFCKQSNIYITTLTALSPNFHKQFQLIFLQYYLYSIPTITTMKHRLHVGSTITVTTLNTGIVNFKQFPLPWRQNFESICTQQLDTFRYMWKLDCYAVKHIPLTRAEPRQHVSKIRTAIKAQSYLLVYYDVQTAIHLEN